MSSLHRENAVVGRVVGKSGQAGLLMEEAGPRLCPEVAARKCLVSIPGPGLAVPQGISYPVISKDIITPKGVRGAS